MTDRTVRVRLLAEIGQYQAQFKKASQVGKEFGSELTSHGKASREQLDKVGRGALLMGGAVAAGIGVAVNATLGFDKQLSELQAVSSATGDQMGKFRDQAIQAGAATQYSASQAAEAQTELAKAGVSTADILGGALDGALSLAAAGGLELGRSAEIAAGAMGTFGLKGRDVGHVADVLAAGANKSAADVDELAQALTQSGLVAHQYGLTLDETTGVLSLFAQNQLKGSDAGTSFKTMLMRLTPQSKEAADKMKELGIDMFDAQGKFIGIQGAAQELQDGLAGLSDEQRNTAMNTIFGSDAVRAATILYQAGAKGVGEWTDKVNDAGFAGDVAAQRMDNLAGDLEALRGSMETVLIEGGSQATGVLRFLAQGATDAVNGFGNMPGVLQGSALGLAAVAGGGLLALGAIGTLAPKVVEARRALEQMGTAGQALSNNLGKIAGAVGVAGAAMAVITTWQTMLANADAEANKFKDTWRHQAMDVGSLDELKGKLKAVHEQMDNLDRQKPPAWKVWDADKNEELNQGIKNLGDLATEQQLIIRLSGDLSSQLGISGDSAMKFIRDQQDSGVDILSGNYDDLKSSLAGSFTEMTTGTGVSKELAGGMSALGDETTSVEDRVKAFKDTLDALWQSMFGVEDAQDQLQKGLNSLPATLKQARADGLNLNDVLTSQSDAAITVRDQMRSMVTDASALIEQWQKQGVTGDELAARIAWLSASFEAQAVSAGLPGPVVDHYLGLLRAIPTGPITTPITANVDPAVQAVNSLIHWVYTQNPRIGIEAYVDYPHFGPGGHRPQRLDWRHGGVMSFASGGMTPAHVAGGEMIRYAEPATGGEAFVPRRGNAARSVGVLEHAAGWYGMGLHPLSRGHLMERGGVTYITTTHITQIHAQGIGDRAIARSVRDANKRAARRGIVSAPVA